MMCDQCGEKEAKVKIVKIVNGQQTVKHLCEDCARAQNELPFGNLSLSLPDLLSDLLKVDSPVKHYQEQTLGPRCPKCGLSWHDFQSRSRLGCEQCYQTFRPQLLPLIRRLHGHVEHRGQVPHTQEAALQQRKALKQLRMKLQEAIVEERFEDAARFRDDIKNIETMLEEGQINE